MAVRLYSAIILLSFFWRDGHAIENKVYFSHGKGTTFREELVVTNVTSSGDFFDLGLRALKWKSITVATNSYAVGLTTTGVCIVKPVRNDFKSLIQSDITDDTNTIKDLELYKIWNSTSSALEAVLVLLLEDDTLYWYTIKENLTLEIIWKYPLEKQVINFKIYPIHSVDHVFVLRRKPGDTGTILEIFKYNLFNARHKSLWLQQTITFYEEVTSFTLNALAYDHFLSIPSKSEKAVRIYKEVNQQFVHQSSIKDSYADDLQSFSIGPNSYLLTNGHNAGIYKMTRHGAIKEKIKHNHFDNIDHWLVMPVKRFKEEIFLLAQKEVDYDSHKTYKLELIHSNGFEFKAYEEIPCVYFGMKYHGIDCILEEDPHHVGINSSAVLPFKDFIGLLMPAIERTSRFFHLNTKLRSIPNPKKEKLRLLREKEEKLKVMHEELKKLRESAQRSAPMVQASLHQAPQATHRNNNTKEYQQRSTETTKVTAELRNVLEEMEVSLEALKTKLKDLPTNKRSFGTLIINGPLEIRGLSTIGVLVSAQINEKDTKEVLDDIVLRGNQKPISGEKTFTNLDVHNMIFDTINGKDKEELLFKGQPIEINGNLNVQNVSVNGNADTGKINNITLENEVLQSGQEHKGPVEFRNITVTDELKMANVPNLDYEDYFNTNVLENLTIASNLTVRKINLDDFVDIQNQIVMRNIDGVISPTTKINGVINITGDANIHHLNGLMFPDEYVFKSSERTQVTGMKTFGGEISTKTLTTNGLINGINTSLVITLSDDQFIPGTVHFSDLSVGEFESTNVAGKDTEDFLQNLILNETTHLKTPAIFQSLQVEGYITIDKINEENISGYLDNIVFKDDENIEITSDKTFQTLSATELHLETLNGYPFNMFVNKETDQELNIKTINGNVTFENLYISGSIGEVNITKILKESIKLNEDQNITLLCLSELFVDNFKIVDKLNDLPIGEYLYSTGDRIVSSMKKMKTVEARNVIVKDNLVADIKGLEDLKDKVLSTIEEQYISGDVHVTELFVGKLDGEIINERPLNQVFNSDFYAQALATKIFEDKIKIKNLNIEGNLTTNKINQLDMTDILKSCTFTSESKLQPNIAFRDDVIFKELTVDIFNGVPFAEFMENLIFKNETSVKLADKHFVNGFTVQNYIDTEKLNGIALDDILRDGNQKIVRGPLNIQGDVVIDGDLDIETLNEVPMRQLKEKVNIDGDTVKINGDLWINNLAYIINFWTYKYVNNENLNDVLKNLVYLNSSPILENKFTFNDKVFFKKDFDLSTINNIDLTTASDDIVMINKPNTIVRPVIFQKPVKITNRLTVTDQFNSNSMMGINITAWKEKAVFIDELIPGKLKFEKVNIAQEIKTEFINNINMSRLIPLRTEQNITEMLSIETLSCFHDISVGETVNGLVLKSEYENTLLNHGGQTITSEINFEDNVMVYNELLLRGKVNGVEFDNIIDINKNRTMNGEYNFLSKVSVGNITVDGLVNGINMTKWQQTSLRKHVTIEQNITEPVHVKNLTIEDYSHGRGLISGLDFRNLSNAMEYKRQFKNKIEGELATDYNNVCQDVNHLLKVAKKQIYKFKHLEWLNHLEFDDNIEMIHRFKVASGEYLLIREKGSCSSHFYQWDYRKLMEEPEQIDMGEVVQIIDVNTDGDLYLVTRSKESSNCEVQRSNLWIFEDNELMRLQELAEELFLLQESQVHNTFYGLSKGYAFEYHIQQGNPYIYRKWPIKSDNLEFVPPGLNTGLALRADDNVIKLIREDFGFEDSNYSYNTQEILIGKVQEENNMLIPRITSGGVVVLGVGVPRTTMVAVISQENAWVKGRTDSIKIYSDIIHGSLFDKIPTYKPSSLVSLELGNSGKTLLVFLEDQRVLQIYEYKGIEGFQHRRSMNFEAEAIIKIKLPLGLLNQDHDALGIIHNNQVTFLEVVTDGENVDIKDLNCKL